MISGGERRRVVGYAGFSGGQTTKRSMSESETHEVTVSLRASGY